MNRRPQGQSDRPPPIAPEPSHPHFVLTKHPLRLKPVAKKVGAAGAVGATFVAAAIAGVVLHVGLPPARRLVAAAVNELLAGTFRGKIAVVRVAGLHPDGIDGGVLTLADPDGKPLALVEGVRARISLLPLFASLVSRGDMRIRVTDLVHRSHRRAPRASGGRSVHDRRGVPAGRGRAPASAGEEQRARPLAPADRVDARLGSRRHERAPRHRCRSRQCRRLVRDDAGSHVGGSSSAARHHAPDAQECGHRRQRRGAPPSPLQRRQDERLRRDRGDGRRDRSAGERASRREAGKRGPGRAAGRPRSARAPARQLADPTGCERARRGARRAPAPRADGPPHPRPRHRRSQRGGDAAERWTGRHVRDDCDRGARSRRAGGVSHRAGFEARARPFGQRPDRGRRGLRRPLRAARPPRRLRCATHPRRAAPRDILSDRRAR